MSDILIRGMEMPKTESEVLIIAIKSDGSVYPVRIDGEGQPMIFPNEEMKNRAVNVPPHGDLIDRDALRDNNCDVFEINGADGTILAMDVSIIDDAPAIIPASE